MKWLSLVLTAFLLFAGVNAEAARMGGGKSMGKQSGNVTQREAAPAQSAGNTAARPAPAAAPAAPRRPWGAMLGGLAAGLGLAWLAHSLGMGEGMGQILMFALLAFGVMMAVGYFMRKRQAASSPLAFQGAGNMGGVESHPYRPENVGNDASARPWEQNTAQYDSTPATGGASGSMIGSALLGSQTWGVPAGFDSEGFIKAAKANFVTLQAAWDKSDISSLRAMMTDGMLLEIKTQLSERESHTGAQPNHTDVQALEARLLGIEELADEYMASVEYTGMIREDAASSPSPFREVWNMTKSKNGGGWLVAGVQALQ
ncbi:MAG: Tim44-like domain-containing protein [Rhodoferax sp.]|nr:Tim44-like domain-containing protein [Rhodoferax sp.]